MSMDKMVMDHVATGDAAASAAVALGAGETDDLGGSELRLKRIDEYEEACVARDDPFASMLGTSTASIERLKLELAAALRKEVEKRPGSVEPFVEFKTQFNQLLKMHDALKFDFVVAQQSAGQAQPTGTLATRVPRLTEKRKQR